MEGKEHKIVKRYRNGDVCIVWRPDLCVHSGICAAGLPTVFDPSRRPWIDPLAATPDQLIDQVGQCPSGALSLE